MRITNSAFRGPNPEKMENFDLLYRKGEPLSIVVKRVFVLSNKCKGIFNEKSDVDRSSIIRMYREIYRVISKFSEADLNNHIEDKDRLYRFDNAEWSIETLGVDKLGVWPGAGGMSDFITCGNLLDTAKKVDGILHSIRKSGCPVDVSIVPERVDKLISTMKYADLVYRFCPIIVTSKGRCTRRVKANREYIGKTCGFQYKITPYDIDDGNHRAIAFAVLGMKKIKCLAGKGLDANSRVSTS